MTYEPHRIPKGWENDPNLIGCAENENHQWIFLLATPGKAIEWERMKIISTLDPQQLVAATPIETIRGIGDGPAIAKYIDTLIQDACLAAEEHFESETPLERLFFDSDNEEKDE